MCARIFFAYCASDLYDASICYWLSGKYLLFLDPALTLF